jgi:hypothetical protein
MGLPLPVILVRVAQSLIAPKRGVRYPNFILAMFPNREAAFVAQYW